MERNDAERLVKLESTIEYMKCQIDKLLTLFSCDNFVKHDDSSYFFKNIAKYNRDNLQKRNGWVSLLETGYRLILAIAGISVIVSQMGGFR